MRNPAKFYSFNGFLYGPGIPGRTVADLERLLSGSGPAEASTPAAPSSAVPSPSQESSTPALVEAKGGDPAPQDPTPGSNPASALDLRSLSLPELKSRAKELGLKVKGTGNRGRITEDDLIRAIEAAQ